MKIRYSDTDESGLDLIAPLWQKLKEYHKERSLYFTDHLAKMTFDIRRQELLNKTIDGNLRIHMATDGDTGEIVGYCASTVSAEKNGEIDSIYIEEKYRRSSIGSNLVQRVLDWMHTLSVKSIIVVVAVGNEEVFPFYSQFELYPSVTVLRQIITPLKGE